MVRSEYLGFHACSFFCFPQKNAYHKSTNDKIHCQELLKRGIELTSRWPWCQQHQQGGLGAGCVNNNHHVRTRWQDLCMLATGCLFNCKQLQQRQVSGLEVLCTLSFFTKAWISANFSLFTKCRGSWEVTRPWDIASTYARWNGNSRKIEKIQRCKICYCYYSIIIWDLVILAFLCRMVFPAKFTWWIYTKTYLVIRETIIL